MSIKFLIFNAKFTYKHSLAKYYSPLILTKFALYDIMYDSVLYTKKQNDERCRLCFLIHLNF